ncbi:MAG: c-type cytochrome biogenesis protein CcmI [Kiloniellales bacterium]
MIFWLLAAAIAAAAVAPLLWPLLARRKPPAAGAPRGLSIFRDQLSEIDRDQELGLIGAAEATLAKREVERRLLAADAQERPCPPAGSRSIRSPALAIVILAPAFAVGLYLALGNPDMPDRPFAERQQATEEFTEDPAVLAAVEQLAERLEADPSDPRGWLVLGRSYAALRRWPEAATAYREAIARGEDAAETHAALGEVLVAGADGRVENAARQAFAAALERAPDEPRANFYAGLALAQDGKVEEALGVWNRQLANAPADAPWRPIVETQVARARATLGLPPATDEEAPPSEGPALEPAAPGPTAEEMAAASAMSPEEREVFIRSMVESLAARLKDGGGSLADWLRLANAYAVLGERKPGEEAVAEAEKLTQGLPESAPELDALKRLKARLASLP